MARADDPPKKGNGKVGIIVGLVTKTPDNKGSKPQKPTPSPKQNPNKGKQAPPKGN